MSTALKVYIGGVIAVGGYVLASSLWQWSGSDPKPFLIYLTLALLASLLKVRLPGITGTYSLGFFFVLAGVSYFTLPETLIVGCGGAVVQSLWNTKQRPTLVQLLFNVGNLSLSIGICFLAAHGPLTGTLHLYPPLALAVVACLFFAINTGLVSGVLSLLQGTPLKEVSKQWYLWSFPYYLIGAVLVGLLPLSGRSVQPESWLLLLPPLYLVHFYYGLSLQAHPAGSLERAKQQVVLFPKPAKLYLSVVITAGLTLLTWAVFHWQSDETFRFVVYLVVAVLASTWKVRLPRMTGTISVNFVVLLAAVAELDLCEIAVISGVAVVVQCLWKPAQPPQPIQLLFNLSSMMLNTALAYGVCRVLLAAALADSLPSFLALATVLLYGSNTLMVSAVLCLVEERPLRTIWQGCCFWSFPYYLVGAGFAAVIVLTSQTVGWQMAFLALPLMALVYVSYRLHLTSATQALQPPQQRAS